LGRWWFTYVDVRPGSQQCFAVDRTSVKAGPSMTF